MNNLAYIVIAESDSPFVKSLNWFLRDSSSQNISGLKFHDCQNLGPSSDCTAAVIKKRLTEMAETFDFDLEAPGQLHGLGEAET
jgi:hypothetical protein